MFRFSIVAALLIALSGCAGINANDVVGAAYAAQNTVTQSILDECQNSTPGGPCVAGSAISTEDKAEAKAILDLADRYTDDAWALVQAGDSGKGLTLLERATSLLDRIEDLLIERGVE